MSERIQFYAPMKIIFKENGIQELASEIHKERVFIVIDKFLYHSEIKTTLDSLLQDKKIQYFYDFSANPDVESMNHGINQIRLFQATTIVGVGGGSTLDIAKFLSVAIHESETVEELRKTGFIKKEKIKCICIPTTAGTGSEVTNVSVISDYKTQEKAPFVDDVLFCNTAILDTQLTLSVPPNVTANCGMDTICHAMEAYWNINANAISDLFAIEALRLALQNVKQCYEHGTDIHARYEMLKASLYAGLAFAQTRTTILHAVSFPLTSKFHIPHGLACAILLPSCISYFGEGSPRLQNLAKNLGYTDTKEMASKIAILMEDMHMECKLHEHGITQADIPMIAKAAMMEKIAYLTPKEMNVSYLINQLKEVL